MKRHFALLCSVIFALFVSLPTFGAIAVGVTSGAAPGFVNNNTLTVSPAASGSTFVVAAYISGTGNGTGATVTDSKGNTYTPSIEGPVQTGNAFFWIFTCQNAIGGASMTVEFIPLSGGNLVMQFIEITGATTPTSIDQTSAAGGSPGTAVSTMPSPSVTTTNANELILGIVLTQGSALDTITATTGTLILQTQDTTNFLNIASSFRIVSSTGANAPGFSGTSTAFYGAGTLSFIQAGGGGASGPSPTAFRIF